MGEMVVVVVGEGEVVVWDPADREQVAVAYLRYAQLRRDGYEFFAVDERLLERRLTRFEKRTPRIVAIPPPPAA